MWNFLSELVPIVTIIMLFLYILCISSAALPCFSLITILMECLITMKFLHIFLHPDVIFSSHTMFINASTKEFTLVNNAISSYDIAFEELLYYKLAPPILIKIINFIASIKHGNAADEMHSRFDLSSIIKCVF